MSWDDAEQSAEGLYLKWDNAPFKLLFPSDPAIEKKHFIAGKPADCEGDECRHCADKVKVDIGYRFDVLKQPGNDEKVFTLSRNAFNVLLKVRKQLGEQFTETVIDCRRSGSGFSTRYSFEATDEVPF